MDQTAQRHFVSCWENKGQVKVYPLAKRYTFWLAFRLFVSIEDPQHVAEFAKPFNVLAAGLIYIPIDLPGIEIHDRFAKKFKLLAKILLFI